MHRADNGTQKAKCSRMLLSGKIQLTRMDWRLEMRAGPPASKQVRTRKVSQ